MTSNEPEGCSTVITVLFLVPLLIALGDYFGSLRIQKKAVELNHAEWVPDSSGYVSFRWKEEHSSLDAQAE